MISESYKIEERITTIGIARLGYLNEVRKFSSVRSLEKIEIKESKSKSNLVAGEDMPLIIYSTVF